MTTKKISDLTAAPSVPESTDAFPIARSGVTYKMTLGAMFRGIQSGSSGAPGLAFSADQDTGMYRVGEDQLGLVAGGARVALVASSVMYVEVSLRLSSGDNDRFRATTLPAGTGIGLESVNAAENAYAPFYASGSKLIVQADNGAGSVTPALEVKRDAGSIIVESKGALSIQDGMTAPSAISGFAILFVDSADGDLKIKFGDGTVKTIVTD